jgi:uncharacterized protein (DUF1501 family)
MSLDRRDFLKASAAATLPFAAPRLVFANGANSNSDVLVVVFQRGGMDGLQAVVPHGDSDYYRLRPSIGIPRPGTGANASIDLDGFFGLHPSAAPLKPLYDSGRLAVVHAAGIDTPSRSHFECQDFYERGSTNISQVGDGWVNRYLQSNTPAATFGAVSIGRAIQPSMRGPSPVLGMTTIANFRLGATGSRAAEMEEQIAGFYGGSDALAINARKAIGAIDELALANPASRTPEGGATYPATTFGNQMRELAQLIKSDLGLRAAAVDLGGWDHHENIANFIGPLLDELSRTLVAFNSDLGQRMANVTVVTMTEFGRRVQQNGSNGTDHGAGTLMFLMGGGVIGRQVVRSWPGLRNQDLVNGDLKVTMDYRTVLSELIQQRMGGADMARVFPGFAPGPFARVFTAR